MIDNEFDPYDALVQACNAIQCMEEVIEDLIKANNNQATLLESTHKAYTDMSNLVQANCRQIKELQTTLALTRKRVESLENECD